jgi:hypothetical protein
MYDKWTPISSHASSVCFFLKVCERSGDIFMSMGTLEELVIGETFYEYALR